MICKTCGGTESYIYDGVEYCRECSLQFKGSQEEAVSDESFSRKSLLSSPSVKKTKKEKKKLFPPWLSFEAYTYILSKQVSALIDLGCSESLRTIVKSLWFRYLQVNEVAFLKSDGKKDFLPRLSFWPSKRDLQLLYGDGSATKKYRKRPKKHKKSKSKAPIYSKRKSVKKQIKSAETSDSAEASESENEKQDSCAEKTSILDIKKDRKKQFETNSNDSASEVSDEAYSDASSDSSIESATKQQKKRGPKYSIHARKLKKRGLKGENSKEGHIHHMTLNKTIAFCYLGLLYSGDQLLLFDLIRLLNDGIVPFVDITRHFPVSMQLLADDFHYFMKYSAPDMKSVYLTSGQLIEFLKLPKFKKPSLLSIAIRFVKDLNLPCEIIPVLKFLFKKLEEKTDKLSDCVSPIPFYEAQAMSLIAVALKMLFVLDGKFEIEHSEIMTKINSVTKDHKFFVWKKWQQQASLKEYLFLKNLTVNTKEMSRLDSLCASRILGYPFNIVRPELTTLQHIDYKNKTSARNELKTLFKDLVGNDFIPKKPTSFPLQSELHNLMNEWEKLSLFKETKHIDFDFISESFASHKLYYRPFEKDSTFDEPIRILLSTLYESVKLFHISDTADYFENVIRTTKKYWYHQNVRITSNGKWVDDFPSSFKWLLNFMCKYLQTDCGTFYQEFRSIERKLIVV